jgi:hypothetical protein
MSENGQKLDKIGHLLFTFVLQQIYTESDYQLVTDAGIRFGASISELIKFHLNSFEFIG